MTIFENGAGANLSNIDSEGVWGVDLPVGQGVSRWAFIFPEPESGNICTWAQLVTAEHLAATHKTLAKPFCAQVSWL